MRTIVVAVLSIAAFAAFAQAPGAAPEPNAASTLVVQPVLSVTPADRPVNSSPGSTTFSVQNTGTGAMRWSAASDAAWATITNGTSGVNAGTITVSYTENTTGAERVATITVTADGATGSPKSVKITQAPELAILSVTPANSAVSASAGVMTFSVENTGTGTMNWTASSGEAWATITAGNSGTNAGMITVSYAANTTTTPRVATITVTAEGATESPKSVTLTQAGEQPILAVTPTDSAVEAEAGTATFTVTNVGNGTLTWTAGSGESWATITEGGSGTGDGTITVSYEANSSNAVRVATITVTADGATNSPHPVTLTQAAGIPVLSVSPSDSAVPAGTGTVAFAVENSGTGTLSWSASSGDAWATITDGNSGTDAGTITVSCTANSTMAPRVATITVTADGATESPKSVTITQAAAEPYLAVSPIDSVVSANAGTATFTVTNDGTGAMDWSANCAAVWATITSGGSGTDTGTITVSYEANTTGAVRVATITVTADGATGSPRSVTITQAAQQPILSITPLDSAVGADAGSTTFKVSNSGTGPMSWSASCGDAWATITSGTSGTDTGTVLVGFTANTTNVARAATITVTADGALGSPREVTITQAAGVPVLTVTPSDSLVSAGPGTAVFTVRNTGTGTMTWTASSADAWATITDGSPGTDAGSITVSFTANTTSAERVATITIAAPGAVGSAQDVKITQAAVVAGIADQLSGIPEEYGLSQNYPNPFNPATMIRFALPKAGQTRLEVFNALGQKVAVLVEGLLDAGFHQVSFDGSTLPSGLYLYRLQAGEYVATKKLVLMK